MSQDWHTHSSLCRHASGVLEDYVISAIDKNLELIGLSAHFPYEFLKNMENIPFQEYAMSLDEIQSYLTTAENLKFKYKHKIEVKIGFEIDYIINQEAAYRQYIDKIIDRLDFTIGSIHNLKFQNTLLPFDDARFLSKYGNFNSIEDLFILYYETMSKMINSQLFECKIVGHFDLPKKFDKKPENDERVDELISSILDSIERKGVVIEVNTSGFRKPINEQYPSKNILKEILDRGIPIILGSDAHSPDEVAFKFDHMRNMLLKLGFKTVSGFIKGKMYQKKL
jgi:histidinol-phosphatase (PHP family)